MTTTLTNPNSILAAYDYTDAAGALAFQLQRLYPSGIRLRQPDGDGGWRDDPADLPPLLYQLPRVRRAIAGNQLVFLVKDEQDVQTLLDASRIATCCPGGLGAWRPEYAEYLRGAHVVIYPEDTDLARQQADAVAQSLYGCAASVKIATLPNLPAGEDLTDWLRLGDRSLKDWDALLREFYRNTDSAQAWTPPGTPAVPDYPLTDGGNAERLLANESARLRYHTDADAWLTWTGRRWQSDDVALRGMVMCVMNELRDDLSHLLSPENYKPFAAHIARSEQPVHFARLLGHAADCPAVRVTAADLDRDPSLLNVNNGLLCLRDYRLYVLLAPHIGNQGAGNTGWIGEVKSIPVLFAMRADYALALASSTHWLARSVGYVGVSDGWQDLYRHHQLTRQYARAEDGNIALIGEVDLSACAGEFTLALAFGHDGLGAGHEALPAYSMVFPPRKRRMCKVGGSGSNPCCILILPGGNRISTVPAPPSCAHIWRNCFSAVRSPASPFPGVTRKATMISVATTWSGRGTWWKPSAG